MKPKVNFSDYYNSINNILSTIPNSFFNKSIQIINKTIKNKVKIYIIGNGGSSSIASHVSVDLQK